MNNLRSTMRRTCSSIGLVGFCLLVPSATTYGQTPAEPPAGWLGVTLSDEGEFDERGVTFFGGYPVISRVEPGSPAAKAGLQPGDVLVSFNSQDMRVSVHQLRNWLKPGSRFELRVRRNDDERSVRGVVERAPVGWQKRIAISVSPSSTQFFERRQQTLSRPSAHGTQGVAIRRTPLPSRVPSALIPAFTFGGGVFPFAGMEFIALNDDIRDVLGVRPEGVFVTNVIEGSPARASGLRGGDVLLLADEVKLETPIDLVNAITEAEAKRTLRLRLLRKGRPQALTLRW